MDGLRIIDNNTGNKWILKSAGRQQYRLERIHHSRKNKRRQSGPIASESWCLNAIKNGSWSAIDNEQ